MEYLMTYGWAILIIAVVLGVVYSLGFFSAASLTPKVQPGTCQVYRPEGAMTTQYLSLLGACNNQLPQYVAQFNGQSSTVSIPSSPFLLSSSSFTISTWARFPSTETDQALISRGTGREAGSYSLWEPSSGPLTLTIYSASNTPYTVESNAIIRDNQWYLLAGTYDAASGTISIYVNGVQTGTQNSVSLGTSASPALYIGSADGGTSDFFSGGISNVQIYNVSMDSNSLTALYREGIGGVPTSLPHLVGWWPLNANPNDYSGNQHKGAPANVIYSNQWYGGYAIYANPASELTYNSEDV
jgi:hypothetical protein